MGIMIEEHNAIPKGLFELLLGVGVCVSAGEIVAVGGSGVEVGVTVAVGAGCVWMAVPVLVVATV